MKNQMEGRKLISYCGLYCGDCFGHKGKIADLARDLRKELRASRFDKLACVFAKHISNSFEYYSQCYDLLGAMVKLRCKKACRGGGGPPFCKIRNCCSKKELEGCWECPEYEECNKLDLLRGNHGDAVFKNLRKLKKKGVEEFLRGKKYWYVKPPDLKD